VLSSLSRRLSSMIGPDVFAAHHARLSGALDAGLRHVPPAPHLSTEMGKVGNVLTRAFAGDPALPDHRRRRRAHDEATLARDRSGTRARTWSGRRTLRSAAVACLLDTGRMLAEPRHRGGLPGTLGVALDPRRHRRLRRPAMFENLELSAPSSGRRPRGDPGRRLRSGVVRPRHGTLVATRAAAYDEIARPWRLAVQLALLPAASLLAVTGRWRILAAAVVILVVAAEIGRRPPVGRACSVRASLCAPLWVAERAVCAGCGGRAV